MYLSVCEHSHGRISWSISTKIGTNVKTPQNKNEFVRGQYRTTPSSILPPKPKRSSKPMQMLSNICLKCTRIAVLKEIGVEEHDGDVRF